MAELTSDEKLSRDSDLWWGCSLGEVARVKHALELGAVHNFIHDDDYVNGFMQACIYGHKAVLELLLEHGADVNARSNIGRTGFMHAAHGGRTDMVDLVLKSGQTVDVNMVDLHGYTALMLAIEGGHVETVSLLLDHGADVDIEGKDRLDPRGRGFVGPEKTPYTRTALEIARRKLEYQQKGESNISTIIKMLEERRGMQFTSVPLRTDQRNNQRLRSLA